MVDIYDNKIAFLNIKPKRVFGIVVLFSILLTIIIYISIKITVYEHYLTKGYVWCEDTCRVISFVPTNIEFQKVKINQKEITFTILDKVLQVDESEMISYYKLQFMCDDKLEDKEIVQLNFYYNKQSMLSYLLRKKEV